MYFLFCIAWLPIFRLVLIGNHIKLIIKKSIYLMWKKMFLLNRNEISDIFIFYIYLRLSDSLLKPKSSSNIEKYKSALEIRNKYWAFLFPIFSYLEFKKSRFLNQTRFRFLKACFSKFYLVRSQIFCLIWSLSQWKNGVVTLHKNSVFYSGFLQ